MEFLEQMDEEAYQNFMGFGFVVFGKLQKSGERNRLHALAWNSKPS